MVVTFKDILIGKRIELRRTLPTQDMATTMFKVVDTNREHLKSWFPWEPMTQTSKDSLKYLQMKEEETQKGTKIEYGIYVNNEYTGNISLFDIDETSKSAEIGYWLSTDHVRHGYMTEAVKLLEMDAFERIKLNRVQIKSDSRNEASKGVAKKCNYTFEGENREDNYNDHFDDMGNTLVFSKLKSEYEGSK